MKKMKKAVLGIVILAVAGFFAGCSAVFSEIDSYKEYQKNQEILYVNFAKEDEEGEPFDYREIDGYVSEFSRYNSHVLYETLTPDEQRIYRLFEYALDHGYTSIFIDERLLEKADSSPEDILTFLCMDSPFVQQNFGYTTGETGFSFSYLYEFLSFEVRGTQIKTELFLESDLQKKKEALAEAEKIVQTLPEGLSELEKARYFYRYLTGQVKYSLYEEDKEAQYLYDAFIKKETQCDGYANAFSLLCALERIPCVEKIYQPEKEGEAGHTWNLFCADGVWYNADCAIREEFAREQEKMGIDFYFGFSDMRQEESSEFDSRLPEASTDLMSVDLVLSSSSDPAMRAKIGRAFRSSSYGYILICLEEGEFSENDLQQIADYLQSDFRSISMTWQGKEHYWFFKTE